MLSRYSLPTLIVWWACTLLTAVLAFQSANLSASHDPVGHILAQQIQHAEMPGTGPHGHAHQHEDGSAEAERWGHQHGHSASDHTHQPLFLAPEQVLILATDARHWSPQDTLMGPNAPVAALERPPKPATA